MTVTFKVDAKELQRLNQRLQSVLEIADKPQLILTQLAKGVIQQTQARIEYEKETPDGKKWAPWSPAYAATRDSGDSLLIDSREMVEDHFGFKVNRRSFTVWNDAEYAAAQNFGRPEINLPARTFMGFSRENFQNIDEWLQGILLGAVKGAKVQQTTRKKVSGKR